MKKTISIIGAPMWLGQTRYGTNLAPDALRNAGLFDRLEAINQDVNDLGNIPITTTGHFRTNDSNVKNLKAIASACDKIAQTVSSVIAEDSFPLVIGGDHSIAIGTIAGVAQHYNNLGVIWYDAHADINTPETTPSGNIHGMPLAVSMGIGHETLVSIGGMNVKVKPENVVFIGVRDIDPGEADLIADKQIKVFTAEDVERLGMEEVIKLTLKHLEKCDGIHLSFDIDGIDPSSMPGVGTPVADGVSYEDSLFAIKLLEQSGCITSAEFVELNPLLDKEGKTTQASVNLIAAFLGEHSSAELGVFARQPDVSIKI